MGIQTKLLALAALIIIIFMGTGYWYFSWSQNEIKILNANNVKLEQAVQTSENAVASLKADALSVRKNLNIVSNEYESARTENNALRAKLAKHNIGYLAAKKPNLVRKILNKGTAAAERCFEILSGAPLTESEIAATNRSQINSSCPSIANPNYKAKL